jgi:hypothetical protein
MEERLQSNSIWPLGILNNLCEKFDMEVGVTLGTPSGFVTGTLVSGRKYHALFIDSLREAGESGRVIGDNIESAFASVRQAIDAETPRPEEETDCGRIVHLRDARIVGPVMIPSDSGLLWLCGEEDVVSFALGHLS